jgi:hypothetical protein
MFQLTYHSIAQPDLGMGDLDGILEEARTENFRRNITSCLVYHNARFAQILEGRKRDVLEVYAKIRTDHRYHRVTLLWEGEVAERYFEEWSMAFRQNSTSRRTDKERNFVSNMRLLSEFSDKSSGSLLSFWATIRKLLNGNAARDQVKV